MRTKNSNSPQGRLHCLHSSVTNSCRSVVNINNVTDQKKISKCVTYSVSSLKIEVLLRVLCDFSCFVCITALPQLSVLGPAS